MSDEKSATDLIETLDPDAIRRRLADLEAEQSALRVLLRAAIARSRNRDRKRKDDERKPNDDGK